MVVKVAINGFGRIGRLVLRSLIESERSGIQVVAINDLSDLSDAMHLLKYDTVHGKLKHNIEVSTVDNTNEITISNQKIQYIQEPNPSRLPWGKLNIDIVMECSGRFTSKEACEDHLQAGASKVLVSAPCKNADITVVYGVNHDKIQKKHQIISNASCTTNCLAPIIKILHDNFTVKNGYMTTIHSYTSDQRIVDSSHSDLRRARAGASNMIPTSTGAAKAIGLVLPEMQGKLEGSSVRVPTPNVSLVDFVCNLEKEASVKDVNSVVANASKSFLQGVVAYCDEPLVSSDFCHHPASSIFDSMQTQIVDKTLTRILTWYDNEWGFSNRMLDTSMIIAKFI